MATIKCKECGTPFEGKGKACYCSEPCRKAGSRKVKAAAQAKWKAKNPSYWATWVEAKLVEDPDYFAAKMRDYDRTNPGKLAGTPDQYVTKVESWEGVTDDPATWTDDQRRAYEDIQRLKRLNGL